MRPPASPDAITVLLEDPRLPYPYQSGGAFNELDRDEGRRLRQALGELPSYRFELLDRHEGLASELASRAPAFVFNLCDTGYRNHGRLEPHIPALLELLEIPYSGAGPEGLVLCRDKSLTRAVAAGLGVPVPAERYLDPEAEARLDGFPYPAILKPNLEDGSRAITAAAVVDGPDAAAARLRELVAELPGSPILLQEFLPGAEYSVGLIGNPRTGFQVLPLNQADYAGLDPELPRILGFEFKNDPDSRYHRQVRYRAAELDSCRTAELVRHSVRLFARLGCRDCARIDYRTGRDGEIRLLEVNPNPGWCWDGKLNLMASFAGARYSDLLRWILEAAQERVVAELSAQPSQGRADDARAAAPGGRAARPAVAQAPTSS